MVVFQKLQAINTDLGQNPALLFNSLIQSKTDVKLNLALGMRNLIIKDYKIYKVGSDQNVKIGVSSMTMPAETLFNHFTYAEFEKTMMEIQKEQQLSLYIFVTSSMDENKKFKKETAVLKNADQPEFLKIDYDGFMGALEGQEKFGMNGKQVYKSPDRADDQLLMTVWQMGEKLSRKDLEKFIKEYFK